MNLYKKIKIIKNMINIIFFIYFIGIGISAYYYGNSKSYLIMLFSSVITGIIIYLYFIFIKFNYIKKLNEYEEKLFEILIKYKKQYLKEIEELINKLDKKIQITNNEKNKKIYQKLKQELIDYKNKYIENDKRKNLKDEVKGKNLITINDVKMKEIEILKEEIKEKL